MKRCCHCKETKDESEFSKNRTREDGLQHICKKCQYGAFKKWLSGDRETRLARKRARYRANSREVLEYAATYRDRNRERINAYSREYYRKNKIRNRMRAAVRRQREVVGGDISPEEWITLLRECGNQCLRCGSTDDLVRDHVVPISRGGRNDKDNSQVLCRRCNGWKYTKTIDYRLAHVKRPLIDSNPVMGTMAQAG